MSDLTQSDLEALAESTRLAREIAKSIPPDQLPPAGEWYHHFHRRDDAAAGVARTGHENPPMDDEVKAVLASGNALKDIMRWHRVQRRLFRQRMADYMQKIAEPADSKGV